MSVHGFNYRLDPCSHCNATFKSKVSLDDHILKKHPEFVTSITRKIYKCSKCVYQTTVKNHFNDHMSVHPETATGCICMYCNASLKSKRALDDHMSVTCAHCNVKLKSKRALDDHVIRKHPDFVTSVSRKIHECSMCSYKTLHKKDVSSCELIQCDHCTAKFKSKLSLDDHVIRKHPEFIASVSSDSETVFRCFHCETTFKSKLAVDYHVVEQHPNFIASIARKIYECTKCGYKTIFKYHFERHMSTHPKIASSYEPKACVHCNATFKRKLWLDDHVVRKHVDFMSSVTSKLHECTKCSYKTVRKKLLVRHFLTHSYTAKSYSESCVHCNAKYQQRISLDDHIIKKHPEFITSVTRKVYECTICPYKTILKFKFDRHMLEHPETASSYKFSSCHHCGAKFKIKADLDEHLVENHPNFIVSLSRKVYECTYCVYKTTVKKSLDKHMSSHPEADPSDKINACIHCNATFKNKADLDEHVVRRHPNFTSSLSRKIYECTQCVYKSLRKKSFVKHMSRHPEAVPGDSLNRCVHCNATLRSKRALDDHVVRKHPDSAAPVGRKILECTECRFKTVLKGSLAQHMLTHFKAYNL
nr:unnamed protein product [Callosobruchus chinensis]